MLGTIVLGHDGTPGAAGAARFAVMLARLAGARLVVACAYPSNPLLVRVRTAFEDRTREQAQAGLGVASRDVGDRWPASFLAVEGPSVHGALHALAEREK